ncbi:MAG: hypothetical protein P8Q57_11025 [Yoonia sp.]|nr:hypothetical protein [Yoonia sp.]
MNGYFLGGRWYGIVFEPYTPADVTFALDADVILASLDAAGISAEITDTQAFMPPETLILRAVDNTVLVSCW